MRDLTIIIPFFNGEHYIQNLVNSIPNDIQIIIVDDLSIKPLSLKKENVTVYRLKEKGYFAGAVNFGINQCNTDVLVLNQDTLLSTGWQRIIEQNRDEYAMIGEAIKGNHPMFPHKYIHGTWMFIRRDVINDVGLLNEKIYPLWGNTAEYQLRLCRQQYKVLPLETIPGFTHFRDKNEMFGSSIKATVNDTNKAKLIRTPPEISVIIPCHNYAHYLPDAIGSLIGGNTCLGQMKGQTFQSFEIVIVDDGSNKEQQAIINKYVTGWNGIRVIRLDRDPTDRSGKYIGKPSALNHGISKAIGKYITVLDADDMMGPQRLENLYNAIEQNPTNVIYDQLLSFKARSKKVNWHNEKTPNNVIIQKTEGLTLEEETREITKLACQNPNKTVYGDRLGFYFWTLPPYDFDHMLNKNCMHAGIMFTKKAWQDVGGYNEEMIYGREDWAMNIALGEKGYCGLKLNEPYYLYRREGQNRTLENTKPEWQTKFVAQIKTIYAHLYRGERTMACCGQGAKTKQQLNGGNKIMKLPAGQKDGTSYVKYSGSRSASFSIWGPATGIQYRVNPKNPVFLVDNNDLHTQQGSRLTGILDVYEGTKFAFNIYEQPVEPVIVSEIQPLIIKPVELEQLVEEEPDDLEYDEITDRLITALETVNTLKDFTLNETYTMAELELMLGYEKETKNRSTAVAWIEEMKDRFDGSTIVEPIGV